MSRLLMRVHVVQANRDGAFRAYDEMVDWVDNDVEPRQTIERFLN